MMIDIGEKRRLEVDNCTIRHGSSSNNFIYDFELLGSKDGLKWTKLYDKLQTFFIYSFQTHYFPITIKGYYFRYFKLIQKENNSLTYNSGNDGTPFIHLSYIEFYGKLDKNFYQPTKNRIKQFKFKLNTLNQLNCSSISNYSIMNLILMKMDYFIILVPIKILAITLILIYLVKLY